MSAFKSQFCNVLCSHKDEQIASKSLEKEVILSWKSLENRRQISVRTLDEVTVLCQICLCTAG